MTDSRRPVAWGIFGKPRRHFALILAVLIFGVPMGAAYAKRGQAECLWRQVPLKVRLAAATGYEVKGKRALDDLPVSDDMVRAAMDSCGVTATSPEARKAIGASLVGTALKDAASQWLAKRGVSRQRLATAWLKTSNVDRQVISRETRPEAPDPGVSSQDMFAGFLRFARRAGAPPAPGWPDRPDPQYDALVDYFLGQAQQEEYERRY